MSNVELQKVSKSFGALKILHEVDVSIATGEFCVLVGPSGCGKSTLLRTIAGLEEVSGGTIYIGPRDVTHIDAARRGVAMVFQSYALYPHMSVYENLGFSLRIAKVAKGEADRRIRAAAAILRLEPYLERRPKQLSGGQRQRVAIGRAMVRSPEVFLFDEPLSNLDAELRAEMRVEIAKLHRELGSTMIYVTHDQVEAMTLADRIVVLRAGRVEQIGSPMELYRNPANRFVAGFIGSPPMNFLEATSTPAGVVCPGLGGLVFEKSVEPMDHPERVIVGLRPEHLMLDPSRSDMSVDLVEQLGGMTYVHLQTSTKERLIVSHMNAEPPRPGTRISVTIDRKTAFFFDPDTERRLIPSIPW